MKTRVNELLQRTGKRQKAAFGICLALVAAGLMWFLDEDTSARSSVHNGDTEVTRIVADLTRGGRAERSWLDISENRFDDLEKQIRRLESQRQELKRDNEKIIEQNTALAADANQAIDAQAEEIRRLRLQVTAVTQDRQGTEKITSQEETGVGRTTGRILPTSINENPFRTARGNIASSSGSRNNALAASDGGKALPVKAAALVHF